MAYLVRPYHESDAPFTREGPVHLFTFQRPGFGPIDLAIREGRRGWEVDHPRSGLSCCLLFSEHLYASDKWPALTAFAARLRRAVERDAVGALLYERAATQPTLNPEFN